jgi:pimeloyl-ACP methyl ester carboxylesterase
VAKGGLTAMQPSPEASVTLPTGIQLFYDTFGDPADPAVLLIMGLGGPMNWWDPGLCSLLAERGYFAIRYDNRDVGRSTKLRQFPSTRRDIMRGYLGRGATPPYTISDLAGDAIGLLDHLGVDQAHVTGVSMGGMIAQTLAIEHPERVLSLVSIMSTVGRRTVGWADPRLFPLLLGRSDQSREAVIERSVKTWVTIGSPRYPPSAEETRRRANETFERGISPSGVIRQMRAILAQPDRTLLPCTT